MKEVSWSNLKLLKLEDVKAGECLKVTGDNEMAFYVIVKPEAEMKTKIEVICSQIDASRGF